MHRSSPLLPALAAALMLLALPAGLHAQSTDKMARDSKPAMGAMKDTSAMKHDGATMDHGTMGKDGMATDGMAKDGMAKDGMKKDAMSKDAMQAPSQQKKTKTKSGTQATGTMAEPAKMSHP
jgi:pentapeptide MXKDX repeat protein